jgi:uncharacterized protein YcfL
MKMKFFIFVLLFVGCSSSKNCKIYKPSRVTIDSPAIGKQIEKIEYCGRDVYISLNDGTTIDIVGNKFFPNVID